MFAQTGSVAPVWTLVGCILLFTVKHYVADFLIQTAWIASGKEARQGWALPLLVHAAGHAGLTLGIVLAVQPRLWWLAAIDLVVHVGIDRSKSLFGRWGDWTPQDARYWWLLGFDQLLHQVTNIGLAAALILA